MSGYGCWWIFDHSIFRETASEAMTTILHSMSGVKKEGQEPMEVKGHPHGKDWHRWEANSDCANTGVVSSNSELTVKCEASVHIYGPVAVARRNAKRGRRTTHQLLIRILSRYTPPI